MNDFRFFFTPSTIKDGRRRFGKTRCFLLQSEGITPRKMPKSFVVLKSQKTIIHLVNAHRENVQNLTQVTNPFIFLRTNAAYSSAVVKTRNYLIS